jgi:predicted transcriptional regulator
LAQQKYYSTEQIKIRILVYLYHQNEGANKNNIQERAIRGRHTQEGNRFRKILEDQCEIGTIEQVDMSHVTQGRVIYKITDKGRKIIESLQEANVREFFGLTEDDFLYYG